MIPNELPNDGVRFRLSSVMLTTALIGICLATGRLYPEWGIVLACLFAPSFVRTALAAEDWDMQGHRMPPTIKVLVFLHSLVVVIALALATLLVWGLVFAACMYLGVRVSEWFEETSWVLGSGVAGLSLGGMMAGWTLILLGRCIWPHAGPPSTPASSPRAEGGR